jgi:hypothetical protein
MGATALKKLLPARSLQAIRRKREELGLPAHRPYRDWLPADERELIELSKTKSAIEIARLIGRGVGSVRTRAEKLDIKFKSCALKHVSSGNALVDAIRERAEQDGIAMTTLDREIGSGHYFSTHCLSKKAKGKTPVMKHIARAVEWFGGELKIDWKDE